MEIEKLLLPVDGSDSSRRACEASVWMARLTGARVLLLHCHKAFPTALGEPYYQQAIDSILQAAKELLNPFRNLLAEGDVAFDERILEGPARQAIARVAAIEKVDLIVMGTRGLGNLEGLVLGSVAHKVLRTAHCPVLVVR